MTVAVAAAVVGEAGICVADGVVVSVGAGTVAVFVGVFTIGVPLGIIVSVGTIVAAGAHEAKIKAISKAVTIFLIFIDYLILQGTAQRFALPACGRAWILFGSRKNSKRGKCSKMPQNPTRQVHALLARF